MLTDYAHSVKIRSVKMYADPCGVESRENGVRAMEIIRIRTAEPETVEDHTPTGVEMWYDPHYRHWVIYPIDAEGNQLTEASYGFGKKEAQEIKKTIEAQIASGKLDGLYY